jgi:hypothetical protein
MKILTWYIATKTDFSWNPGKFGRYFKRHLEPELWKMLARTYSGADYGNTWDALYATGDLFREVVLTTTIGGIPPPNAFRIIGHRPINRKREPDSAPFSLLPVGRKAVY